MKICKVKNSLNHLKRYIKAWPSGSNLLTNDEAALSCSERQSMHNFKTLLVYFIEQIKAFKAVL